MLGPKKEQSYHAERFLRMGDGRAQKLDHETRGHHQAQLLDHIKLWRKSQFIDHDNPKILGSLIMFNP